MPLVIGRVDYHQPRLSDGAWIGPDSFGPAGYGACPACYLHWRDGHPTLKHRGLWHAGPDGLTWMHALDDDSPLEQYIAAEIRAGRMLLSHGLTASAEETAIRETAYNRRVASNPSLRHRPRLLMGELIQHMSYGPEANFPSQSLQVIS